MGGSDQASWINPKDAIGTTSSGPYITKAQQSIIHPHGDGCLVAYRCNATNRKACFIAHPPTIGALEMQSMRSLEVLKIGIMRATDQDQREPACFGVLKNQRFNDLVHFATARARCVLSGPGGLIHHSKLNIQSQSLGGLYHPLHG